MKKLFKYTLPALALCALASCSSDDYIEPVVEQVTDPNSGKEMIAFTGEGNSMTRASLTRAAFDDTNETEILMKIVALKNGSSPDAYRNTVTTATASAKTTTDGYSTSTLLGKGFEHSSVSYKTDENNAYNRYWDDAFGRDSYLSIYAVAVPGKTGEIAGNEGTTLLTTQGSVENAALSGWYSASSDASGNTIDWTITAAQTATTMAEEDLTYSNNIQAGGSNGRYVWNYTTSAYTYPDASNDGCLIWQVNPSDANATTGKFNRGHLIFKHALSMITIKLTEGDGFNHSANTDFIWTGGTDQNIELYGFPLSGTLNVKTGTWSSPTTKTITYMNETTGTPANTTTRTVSALCLPNRDLSAATGNVIRFQIDNNYYYVTGTQIVNAIRTYYSTGAGSSDATKKAKYKDFTTMAQGENYVINLTIGKNKIDNITAEVIEFETVESVEIKPSNVHTTSFAFEVRSTNTTTLDSDDDSKFYIYRTKKEVDDIIDETYLAAHPDYTWWTGYNTGDTDDENNSVRATKNWNSTTSKWDTNWYWPDNKTYYHFRAVGDYAGNALAENFVTTDGNDYFSITSGSAYKDYIWGAPFTYVDNAYKIKYGVSTNGFDGADDVSTHQISKGISVTDNTINMLLFHMTSQINVKVQTTADGQPDKVNLYVDDSNKTQVNLLRIAKDGTVKMGNGLVTPTSTITATDAMTYQSKENIGSDGVDAVNYFYGIVPQTLSRGDNASDKVGLQIITPDGNEYFIQDLSKYTGTVTNNNLYNPYKLSSGSLYTINRWLPDYSYTYTVTIKKTGIVNITAAVVEWEEVISDLGTIDLEN